MTTVEVGGCDERGVEEGEGEILLDTPVTVTIATERMTARDDSNTITPTHVHSFIDSSQVNPGTYSDPSLALF